ncbi:hypothetical protein G7046_g1441 [Stylonectria norvegica]|nr:hypothetical protein G7046_g1441 [Stylonectria norvegica]
MSRLRDLARLARRKVGSTPLLLARQATSPKEPLRHDPSAASAGPPTKSDFDTDVRRVLQRTEHLEDVSWNPLITRSSNLAPPFFIYRPYYGTLCCLSPEARISPLSPLISAPFSTLLALPARLRFRFCHPPADAVAVTVARCRYRLAAALVIVKVVAVGVSFDPPVIDDFPRESTRYEPGRLMSDSQLTGRLCRSSPMDVACVPLQGIYRDGVGGHGLELAKLSSTVNVGPVSSVSASKLTQSNGWSRQLSWILGPQIGVFIKPPIPTKTLAQVLSHGVPFAILSYVSASRLATDAAMLFPWIRTAYWAPVQLSNRHRNCLFTPVAIHGHRSRCKGSSFVALVTIRFTAANDYPGQFAALQSTAPVSRRLSHAIPTHARSKSHSKPGQRPTERSALLSRAMALTGALKCSDPELVNVVALFSHRLRRRVGSQEVEVLGSASRNVDGDGEDAPRVCWVVLGSCDEKRAAVHRGATRAVGESGALDEP